MNTPCAVLSDDPMSAIEAFRTAMTSGDVKGLADIHVGSDITIIDKVVPFVWKGPTALSDWMLSMTLYSEERDIRDGCIVYRSPVIKLVDGDQAYIVVPAVWSYKSKEIPIRHAATITFALRRTLTGWKIDGWSWNRSD